MQADRDVQEAFDRYETVRWVYDGLGGKVIRWTKQHGSDHDDPSVLVFVTDSEGNVIEKARNAYQASSFGKWLVEQADAYERTHPRTRMPFVRAKVTVTGEGDARRAACEDLDAAREAGEPVLVFVGRSSRPDDDRKAKGDVKASLKMERGVLDSDSAADEAGGVVLLRLDVADDAHALLAKQLGAEKVPTLLLLTPGADEPEDLGARITGPALAHKLKKLTEDG